MWARGNIALNSLVTLILCKNTQKTLRSLPYTQKRQAAVVFKNFYIFVFGTRQSRLHGE